MQEAGIPSVEQLAHEENETLLGILSLRAKDATPSLSAENGASIVKD
jgi:hypothetical protein